MARTAWWSWIVQFWILDILWYIGSICCGNALLSQLGRNNPAELFLGAVFIESSSQVHVKDTHQRQDKHELLYPWREGATTPIIGANLKPHHKCCSSLRMCVCVGVLRCPAYDEEAKMPKPGLSQGESSTRDANGPTTSWTFLLQNQVNSLTMFDPYININWWNGWDLVFPYLSENQYRSLPESVSSPCLCRFKWGNQLAFLWNTVGPVSVDPYGFVWKFWKLGTPNFPKGNYHCPNYNTYFRVSHIFRQINIITAKELWEYRTAQATAWRGCKDGALLLQEANPAMPGNYILIFHRLHRWWILPFENSKTSLFWMGSSHVHRKLLFADQHLSCGNFETMCCWLPLRINRSLGREIREPFVK